MRYQGTTALVTGASSGLGEQFAIDLARRGTDLVLVARRLDRLEALAQRLRDDHGVSVVPLSMDLTQPGAAAAVRQALDERGTTISTLINNAGFGATGSFAEATGKSIGDLLAVNVTALAELTHTFLPDLVARGDGALVNLASVAAYQPIPNMSLYAASKAFVLSFTEALAHELRDSGVRVLALSPGSTRTEFYATSNTSERGARFETPPQVVATALRALDARRTPPSVISGRYNRAVVRAGRLPMPRRLALDLAARTVHPA